MKKNRLHVLAWALTLGFLWLPLFSWGSHQMPITFSGYTRSEPLTNFPALVTFTNYTGFLSSSGYDLRFWTNSAATGSQLNYEISLWTNSGTSFVWVQVPELTNSTTIYATWGRPAYNSQAAYTTNGAVWTNMYAAVWHMGQATNPVDSCRFPNDHSVWSGQYGDLTNTFLGYGLSYTNRALSPILNSSDLATTNFTCSYWIFDRSQGGNTPSGTGYGTLFGDLYNGGSSPGLFRHRGTDYFTLRNSGAYLLNAPIGFSAPDYNTWHHYAWSGSFGSPWHPYVITDGSTLTTASSGMVAPIAPYYLVGCGYDNLRGIDGILAEMRMSTNIMSTNWVYAEYLNMASNTVFNLYGTVTTVDRNGTQFFFH